MKVLVFPDKEKQTFSCARVHYLGHGDRCEVKFGNNDRTIIKLS